MAKFSRESKLSKAEREHILYEFVFAISELRTIEEAMQFVRDLLSAQEMEMLAKRVKIAELLLEGQAYQEIQGQLKVSHTTIARVGEWLRQSGDGYRLMAERLKKKRKEESRPRSYGEWNSLKKRYPMMFWPQLLLEEIVASANKRQKERLHSMLREMGEKSELHKQLQGALKQNSARKNRRKQK